MPLYMDVHNDMEDLTPEAIERAHQADLEAQENHGVEFLRYWFDKEHGKVFCLSRAPDAEAAKAVHAETGHPADEIYKVEEGA